MTRRQKKHELFVTYHYNNGKLSARRKPKTTYMQLIPNFLKALKNAFTTTNTAR